MKNLVTEEKNNLALLDSRTLSENACLDYSKKFLYYRHSNHTNTESQTKKNQTENPLTTSALYVVIRLSGWLGHGIMCTF